MKEIDATGTTIEDAVTSFPEELSIDAVGVWQLVGGGRGFDLEGDELDAFVRRAIYGLIDAGALPVEGGRDGDGYEWIVQPQYGSTKEEIADRIIAEWRATVPEMRFTTGIWFARPHPDFPRYVKLA